MIAQLRQRLSYEFSELANYKFNISKIRGFTPVIAWLAGVHQDARYDRLWKTSVSHTLNISISEYTQNHAQMIVDVEQRISDRYLELGMCVAHPRFAAYNRVFDRFGFGLDNRSLLLFNIYPFEKFLVNGKRWIEYEESRGKLQKRDHSLRKFQAFLGLSHKISQSGDKDTRHFGGSTMIRSHLYMWALCQIAPSKHGYKVDTKVARQLSDPRSGCLRHRYRQMREQQKVNGKDALIRILFKATRMLFYELVSELNC